MSNGSRSKYWVFTANNYTELDVSLLAGLYEAGKFTYLVYGKEVGANGTRHLQGYFELPQRYRFAQVKAMLPSYHLETRRGTAQEASEYCQKDGDFVQYGTISRSEQGRRRDLERVASMVKEGLTIKEIAEEEPQAYIKYYKGIVELIKTINPVYENTPHTEKRFDLDFDWTKTQVFLGPAGCGKTTYALQVLPKALFCTHMDDLVRYNTSDYDGIIFDEASFVHLPREAQIHLCDQDQARSLHVRYMCARIPAHTKKIFTSNRLLHEILLIDPAIERRIQVHEF